VQEPSDVAEINFDKVAFEPSVKGWELYSWPNGNDWNFSILPGTNRLKSYNEVTENRFIACGIDPLKLFLARIPENEQIFWIEQNWLKQIWHDSYGDLCLPDKQMIIEIKDYCLSNNLVMNVDE
jgi:hypothetical protein